MRKTAWLLISLSFSLSAGFALQMTPARAEGGMHYTYQGHDISKAQFDALNLFNASFGLMQKGDYAGSLKSLEDALALDPKLYSARTNYGFMLGRVGRTDEGIAQLKQAVEIDPTQIEAMSTLASMYQASGSLNEAIDTYTEALKRHPKHQLSPMIESVIKQLKEQRDKEAAVAKTLSPEEMKADYFAFATYDDSVKWIASRLPIKVYIPSDAEVKHIPGFRPEFNVAMKEAFMDWAKASNNAVKYNFVSSKADCDIDVLWTNNPAAVSRPSEGGEARVGYDTGNGINHVQIIILTKTPDGGDSFMPTNLIKAACLHEIGHSLGILGHSPDPNDVMFCSVPAADQPRLVTARDGATLAHIYRDDIKMAHHFHEDAPMGTDKISLNNQGVGLAGAGQYVKAAERFEASLKMDPAYEPAKQNLGACLNNLGIMMAKDGKYPEAAARFKRALELMSATKDKDKMVTTMRNYAFVLTALKRTAEAQAVRAQVDQLSSSAATSLQRK